MIALLLLLLQPMEARAQFLEFEKCGVYRVPAALRENAKGDAWLELYPGTTRKFLLPLAVINPRDKERWRDMAATFEVRVLKKGGSKRSNAIWIKALGDPLSFEEALEDPEPKFSAQAECLGG
jgi:hypothetical protein